MAQETLRDRIRDSLLRAAYNQEYVRRAGEKLKWRVRYGDLLPYIALALPVAALIAELGLPQLWSAVGDYLSVGAVSAAFVLALSALYLTDRGRYRSRQEEAVAKIRELEKIKAFLSDEYERSASDEASEERYRAYRYLLSDVEKEVAHATLPREEEIEIWQKVLMEYGLDPTPPPGFAASA